MTERPIRTASLIHISCRRTRLHREAAFCAVLILCAEDAPKRNAKSSMSYIPTIWVWLGIIACIALSALFAGLNLAIFSLSQLRL